MTIPDDLSGLDDKRQAPADSIDDDALTVATAIATAREVFIARSQDPDAHPDYKIAVDDLAVARSILGHLLAAGWVAPERDGMP